MTIGMQLGSVLGPVLFSIFINDLDEGIKGILLKFTDDTKLGRVANTSDNRIKIQYDLNRIG